MTGKPRRIQRGTWADTPGVFWAWPVDGYWDIHHAPEGFDPDGTDVLSEFHSTFAETRQWVRGVVQINLLLTGKS